MRIERDLIWKSTFRKYLKEFYGFFFPKSYHRIDWSKGVTFLDKELHKLYIESNQQNRVADVLVSLYLKSGKQICVLLHVEIQGYTDKLFAFRFHQMRYRIEETFNINPLTLAIYTDDDPNFHPKQYQSSIFGSKTLTVFNTYKVMDNPPSTYKKPNDAIALIMEVAYHATQAKRMKDEDIINLHLPIVRKLFAAGFPKDEIIFLKSFIESYVKFDNQNNYLIFGQNIREMVTTDFETTEDILAILDTTIQIERLEQKAHVLEEEKERERQEKERERQEKERERQEKERYRAITIQLMLNQGNDISFIANALGLSIEQILEIQELFKNINFLDDNHNATN